MKTILSSLFLFALSSLCMAQNYKKEFNEAGAKKDTSAQRKVLEKWEKANSDDPELYVACFNFYVQKSRITGISIDKTQKSKDAFSISDSSGNIGYLNGSTIYLNNSDLKRGFNYISVGIAKFPSRLDMRFGKIYMYGENKDYKNFTEEIIQTIDYSNINKNKWTWTNGEEVKDPKKFMLGSVQSYILQLYNTNDDALLNNMKEISETVLKYYPDHVESMSNISIVYSLQKNFDKALEILLQAEKIAPKDYIILANIAQTYKEKKDYKNSIKYYKLVEKYGDQSSIEFAKEQITELKKK